MHARENGQIVLYFKSDTPLPILHGQKFEKMWSARFRTLEGACDSLQPRLEALSNGWELAMELRT